MNNLHRVNIWAALGITFARLPANNNHRKLCYFRCYCVRTPCQKQLNYSVEMHLNNRGKFTWSLAAKIFPFAIFHFIYLLSCVLSLSSFSNRCYFFSIGWLNLRENRVFFVPHWVFGRFVSASAHYLDGYFVRATRKGNENFIQKKKKKGGLRLWWHWWHDSLPEFIIFPEWKWFRSVAWKWGLGMFVEYSIEMGWKHQRPL